MYIFKFPLVGVTAEIILDQAYQSSLVFLYAGCNRVGPTCWKYNTVSLHAESVINIEGALDLKPLCAGPNSRPSLVKDAVKVAFRLSGTFLSCHIQPPWGGFEGVLVLWYNFLSCWQKSRQTGPNVGLLILNSAVRQWLFNSGRQGSNSGLAELLQALCP